MSRLSVIYRPFVDEITRPPSQSTSGLLDIYLERRPGLQVDAMRMPRLSRRDFLARMVGAAAGGMAALLGIPGAVFLIGPSQQRTAGGWVAIGPPEDFVIGEPKLVNATVAKQQGWVVEQKELSMFVSTQDGVEFSALSDRCTHLACRVRFVSEVDETGEPGFFCPCHNGVFAADGEIVAGPIPRPLDRLETKIELGQLFVKEP